MLFLYTLYDYVVSSFSALLYVNLKVLLRVSMVTETPMDGEIRYMPTYNL